MTEVLSSPATVAPESALHRIPGQRHPADGVAVGNIVLQLPDGEAREASEGTSGPSTASNGSEDSAGTAENTPPGGTGQSPEAGERGREIIAYCDMRTYYDYRAEDDQRRKRLEAGEHEADVPQVPKPLQLVRFTERIAAHFGPDVGAYLRLLESEIHSNYWGACAEDIRNGRDNGHRDFEVSQDKGRGGREHVIYRSDQPLSATVFNVYARAFGQTEEPVLEAERRARAAAAAAAEADKAAAAEARLLAATILEAQGGDAPAGEILDSEEAAAAEEARFMAEVMANPGAFAEAGAGGEASDDAMSEEEERAKGEEWWEDETESIEAAEKAQETDELWFTRLEENRAEAARSAGEPAPAPLTDAQRAVVLEIRSLIRQARVGRAEGDEIGEHGRGIPQMLILAERCSIRRNGTPGAEMHLVLRENMYLEMIGKNWLD